MKLVRLTDRERQQIREAVEEVSSQLFFEWEEISLFGSRINFKAKGGDIDLYIKIKSNKLDFNLLQIKHKLRIAFQDRLGDQKIDIVIDDSVVDLKSFGKIIKRKKVILWKKK